MLKFDVVVVGSGPSGAMAAYEAAESNLSVAILEKETLPRYKTCGGGLVQRGRELLPFDISPVVECEFHTVQIAFSGNPCHFQSSRPHPIVSMVMREQFDEFLVEKARERGVLVLENCRLSEVGRSNPLILNTTAGPIQTRYLIAADGVFSPTAKLAGWKDDRILIPALEYEVEVEQEAFDRLSGTVRFDVDAVPNGYGWCFPKSNHLSIGVCTFKKGKINLRDYYLQYFQSLDISRAIKEESHGYQIPISYRSGPLAKNGVFLAGDSAGLADPLTAEGISNAIFSGILAGKTIREYYERPEEAMRHYQAEIENSLLGELKTAQFASGLFYHHVKTRNLLLEKYGQTGCEILTDIFTGKRHYPTHLRRKIWELVKTAITPF